MGLTVIIATQALELVSVTMDIQGFIPLASREIEPLFLVHIPMMYTSVADRPLLLLLLLLLLELLLLLLQLQLQLLYYCCCYYYYYYN